MDKQLIDEIIQINEARGNFARFLGSIFLYELNDEQIENLAHVKFENDGTVMAQGYTRIVEYLRHRNRATRQELAVDYAHTFLGAGTYDHVLAPPYESVFTSKERLLMQGARDGALAYYRSEDMDLPAENTTPEDHLGFELQFVATLCERMNEALQGVSAGCADNVSSAGCADNVSSAGCADDSTCANCSGVCGTTSGIDKRVACSEERALELLKKQRSFFKFHQNNWLPEFADAIDEFCNTDFYHGVANLVRGYLEIESATLEEMAQVFGLDNEEEVEIRSPWMDLEEDEDCSFDYDLMDGEMISDRSYMRVNKSWNKRSFAIADTTEKANA